MCFFMHINSEFLEITQILILVLVTKMANPESYETSQSSKIKKLPSNGSTAPL